MALNQNTRIENLRVEILTYFEAIKEAIKIIYWVKTEYLWELKIIVFNVLYWTVLQFQLDASIILIKIKLILQVGRII